jgi:DNA polymerase elongation subunit (family B)
MKVMGLDTKKTTIPAHVSEVLNGFVESLLTGKRWEDVSLEIVAYKEKLRKTPDIRDIGLPKGVSKVEEYTREYKVQGENARLPGHVAAAIHYNQCLAEFGDKNSLPITSGMKIKVFYLTSKYGKFKSIALPTDTEVVPEWLLENFQIDIDAHIERLVDNPLSNILKAIGRSTPTKQSLFTESLLEY